MKEEETDVVEIDAIGAEEWERDRHTPQAIESNLAALVKQSASSNSGPVRAKTVDDEWGEPVPAAPEKPRTTTNTLRRTQAMGTPIVKPQVPGVSIGKLALERPRTEPGAAKPPTSAKASGQIPALGRASTQVPAISKGSAQITAKRPATQTNTEVADPPPPRVTTNTVARKDATPVPATKSAVGEPQTAPRKDATPAPVTARTTTAKPDAVEAETAQRKDATPVPASARTSSAVEAQPRKDATPAPATARTTTGAAKPAAVVQTAPRKDATPAPATARTTTGAAAPVTARTTTGAAAPKSEVTSAAVEAAARATTGAAAPKPAVVHKGATPGPKDWRDVPATATAKPPATPARKDSTPLPTATANKASTRNDATPVLGMKSIVEAQVAARQVAAASTLDLPAWPPQAGSQPPPPPFEDWEDNGKYPDKPLPKRTRDEIAHDFKDEDSIIIDLGAKPKLDDDSERRRRPQSYPVIQTSEQSSTTSGVFVMPTAAVPNATAPAIGATHETNPFAQAIKTNPLVAEFAPVETAAAALPYGTNPFPAPPARQPAESPFAAATSPGSESLDFAASTNPVATETNPFAVAARTSTASAWNTPLPAQLPDQPAAVPPSWPSASNLADINSFASTEALGQQPLDDLAIPTQLPHVEKTAPARVRGLAFLGSAERRRSIAIVAGGSIALFLVLILAFGGSSSKASATATATKTQATPTAVASTVATSQKPAAATLVAVASTTETDADPSSSPTAKNAPTSKQPIAKRRYFKAKKPVVVDYDKSNDPTASKDEALARARAAYAAGNQHLFAGEADAAVSSYKQALADYPSYVAGYRGLGLAYAQQNNRPAALAAFKTYVKLAPTAKDVALIEKRIRNLSVAH